MVKEWKMAGKSKSMLIISDVYTIDFIISFFFLNSSFAIKDSELLILHLPQTENRTISHTRIHFSMIRDDAVKENEQSKMIRRTK